MPNEPIICPECDAFMRLNHGRYGYFFSCCNYPTCTGTHAADAQGNPVGAPVDKLTRHLRGLVATEIHILSKQDSNLPKILKRRYRMLVHLFMAEKLGWNARGVECITSNFSAEQCERLLVCMKPLCTMDIIKWARQRGHWGKPRSLAQMPKMPGRTVHPNFRELR